MPRYSPNLSFRALPKTDADFLKAMIPHHQEAVDTSAYMLTRTENPALQKFGREVIAVQSGEVDRMKAWHQDWFSQTYQDAGTYLPMMGTLDGLQGAPLDRAYLQGMIEHHQGAIAMAKQIQTLTQRPELKRFATAIISTQSQEVEQLRGWLQTTALPESSASPAKSDPGHSHPEGSVDHAH